VSRLYKQATSTVIHFISRPRRSTTYEMRPIVTDRAAWSVGLSVGLSVCRFVTLVNPAKTAEPIEMPFGLRTLAGPGDHVLDGVQMPVWKGQF